MMDGRIYLTTCVEETKIAIDTEDFNNIKKAVKENHSDRVYHILQDLVRQFKGLNRDQLIELCKDALEVKSLDILTRFFTEALLTNSDGTRSLQTVTTIIKFGLTSSFECFQHLLSNGLQLTSDNYEIIFKTLKSTDNVNIETVKYLFNQPGIESLIKEDFFFHVFGRGDEKLIECLLEYDFIRKQVNTLVTLESEFQIGPFDQHAPIHCCLLNYGNECWTGPRDKQFQLRCMEMIVKAGADINLCCVLAKDNEIVAPILMAARNGYKEFVWYFLQNGVDLHTHPTLVDDVIRYLRIHYLQNLEKGQQPQSGHPNPRVSDIDILLKCLEHLYQLKGVPYSPETPAHIALYLAASPSNDQPFMALLDEAVKNGLNFRMSHLPLMVKVMGSLPYDESLIRRLVDLGCSVNLQGELSPLNQAAGDLKKEVVCLLLEHGAEVNAKSKNWINAGCSCLNNEFGSKTRAEEDIDTKIAILEILIEAGLDYKNPESGLFPAAFCGYDYDESCIWYLIKKGLDVNNICINGKVQNILHISAEYVHDEDFLTELLSTGVDIEQMGGGHTPLTQAVTENAELTNVLIENGCDVNRRNEDGETPLFMAVENGCSDDVVEILLNAGAEVKDLMERWGMATVQEQCQGVFNLILEQGGYMYLNHRDSDGFRFIQRFLVDKGDICSEYDEPMLCRVIAHNCVLDDLRVPDDPLEYRILYYETNDLGLFKDKESSGFKRLLYLSGASKEELSTLPKFRITGQNREDEDDDEEDGEGGLDSVADTQPNIFSLEEMCFKQSLKSLCRRIIRQCIGLGIKQKVKKLTVPDNVQDFILLKDEIPEHLF